LNTLFLPTDNQLIITHHFMIICSMAVATPACHAAKNRFISPNHFLNVDSLVAFLKGFKPS